MAAPMWFYAEGEARIGPVDGAEIQRQIAAGRIVPETLVWTQGMQDWVPASARFSFAPAGMPPVLPGRVPGGGPQTGADGLYVGAPARSFGEAISVCFNNYVRFKGRASRSEYWWFFLFCALGSIVTSLLDIAIFGNNMASESGPVSGLFSLVVFLPTMAVTWRRLHDTGRSGWWIGAFYIGVAVVLLLIVLAAVRISLADSMPGVSADMALAALGGELVGLVAILGIGVLIYAIVLLVFFCQRGEPGPNRFG